MRNAVETTVVLLLLLLITLSGCGKSDVEAYREASNADTVNAYEDFLRKHGDSEFRAEATNRIRELRKNIRDSLCLACKSGSASLGKSEVGHLFYETSTARNTGKQWYATSLL